MKSNSFTTVLNVLLALCLLATLVLSAQFIFQTRAYRAEGPKVEGINGWHTLLRAFAADCVEYSKKNPDILPLLEPVGWTGTKPAAPATPAAAAKPTTK